MGNCHRSLLVLGRNLEALAEEDDEEEMEEHQEKDVSTGPEVIKHFSCSTQLSTKSQLLIKIKYLHSQCSCLR